MPMIPPPAPVNQASCYGTILMPYPGDCDQRDPRGSQNPIAKAMAAEDKENAQESDCSTPVWFLVSAAGVLLLGILSGKGRV